MQCECVISPVRYSPWATPLVIVKKPSGRLRLCGNFKATLNTQSHVEDYPLPRADDLFTSLAGGQFFSKVDLAEAYLQLPLDEPSKQLAVINTPLGLFRLNRLMFGIASAPAIFQRYLEQLLRDVHGCINYLDDIVVTGCTPEEHLANLRTLFLRLREAGLKCNREKCSFFQPSITYLGHVISSSGISPSFSYVAAISALPQPSDVHQLQSFLGKVAYYRKFIPNAAHISEPLYHLCKKNVPYHWTPACERAFQALKAALQSATCLMPYTPSLPLILATDASEYGVGAVLSHRLPDGSERPIAYVSKTLTDAQRKYSQIEKEALAIVFACTKFFPFLYGTHFHLITDHKPLQALFAPSAQLPTKTSHRLQRWALFLSRFRYTLHFRSTSQHANADALSRLPCGPDHAFDSSDLLIFPIDEAVNNALQSFPITSRRVAEATSADPVLRIVRHNTQTGWPSLPPPRTQASLRLFYTIRHHLLVVDGVLLRADEESSPRVIVPAALQPEVLRVLHQGHWGMARTKALGRRHVFWFGMSTDIENMVRRCVRCASHLPKPQQSFQPWPAAQNPWERIHVDFAGPFLNCYWLVVTDAYSHFPYIARCPLISTQATVAALVKIFAIEGLPQTLVSDNGPQFRSLEFEQFCQHNGIHHLFTPPFHPQSNGEAERLVRTFKTQMLKYTTDMSPEEALTLFLSTYRTTPIGDKSPAELLHGRQPRTLLHLLRPSARPRPSPGLVRFTPGTLVWARGFGPRYRWLPATVVCSRGRMLFDVRIDDRVVSRHRNQLRPRFQDHPSPPSPIPVAQPALRPVEPPLLPSDHGSSHILERPAATDTQAPAPVIVPEPRDLSAPSSAPPVGVDDDVPMPLAPPAPAPQPPPPRRSSRLARLAAPYTPAAGLHRLLREELAADQRPEPGYIGHLTATRGRGGVFRPPPATPARRATHNASLQSGTSYTTSTGATAARQYDDKHVRPRK